MQSTSVTINLPSNMVQHAKRYSRWGVITAAVIAVLFPSSTSGIIHPQSMLVVCGASILMLASTVRVQRWQGVNTLGALAILGLFLIFTVLSPLSYVAWGGIAPYLLLLTVLLTDLKRVAYGHGLVVALFIINITLLFLGFGTVFGNEFALNIIANYYQMYSADLFETMILYYAKPVTVFATHSSAAFAYFALFCLNLRIASSTLFGAMHRRIFFIFSIGYLCMIPLLMSATSFLLFLVAIPIIGSYLLRDVPPFLRRLLLVTLFCVLLLLVLFVAELEVMQMISALSTEGGGFLGRYTSGGRLQGTYDFLIDNYFQPVGLTHSSDLAFGDNFIAEYIIKISIFGYLLILLMLFVWLRNNVFERRSRVMFFLFFLLADLGYPLLPYYRVIGFLPLFVIIWNSARPRGSKACLRSQHLPVVLKSQVQGSV